MFKPTGQPCASRHFHHTSLACFERQLVPDCIKGVLQTSLGRKSETLVAWLQLRGLQAQLADARQQQKEQAADKAGLQARLQAANDQATAHDAENSKLQVDAVHTHTHLSPIIYFVIHHM